MTEKTFWDSTIMKCCKTLKNRFKYDGIEDKTKDKRELMNGPTISVETYLDTFIYTIIFHIFFLN